MGITLRKLAYALGATTATASACVAYERMPASVDPESTFGQVTSPIITAVRFTRSLRTAAIVAADYRILFSKFTDYQSDEYKAARSIVHERTADKLLRLARAQGAVYVKIGQHVASMNHTVPKEYWTKLRLLEDHAAHRPFWQIERTLNREYSPRSLNQVFSHIEHTPVAAASLAQVHEATLKENNQRVAVKIQYPGLEALVKGDLMSIRLLSWMLNRIFPFFNADWLVDQFRANLRKEVDFLLEADSANRTATFFEKSSRIHVPRVHNAISTKRILVMDYIDGFRIDNVDAMEKEGIDTSLVAHDVIDAFARMIFINGFVHCDPHPGNVMVRPKTNGGKRGDFEIFLLDHGLYRELDNSFRHAYCKLWKGLVLRRYEDVKEACDQFGSSGLENLFSIMLLQRSWKSAQRMTTDIRKRMTPEEIEELKEDLRKSGFKKFDLTSLVEQIPNDLLLVFKMNALVRNVNKALGASINRFKLNARYAVRGLSVWNDDGHLVQGIRHNGSPFTVASSNESNAFWSLTANLTAVCRWFSQFVDVILVEAQLVVFDIARYAISWWPIFSWTKRLKGHSANDQNFLSKDLDNLIG